MGPNFKHYIFTADKLAPFPRIHKKLYHRTMAMGARENQKETTVADTELEAYADIFF